MMIDTLKKNKPYIFSPAVIYGNILSSPVFDPALSSISEYQNGIQYKSPFLFPQYTQNPHWEYFLKKLCENKSGFIEHLSV